MIFDNTVTNLTIIMKNFVILLLIHQRVYCYTHVFKLLK